MKKLSVLAVAVTVAAFATFSPNRAMAQKYQGQMNLTAGGSFSLTGLAINAVTDALANGTGVTSRSTPGLNGMFDYGITDRFSLGAAYHFQNFRTEFTGYTDTAGNNVVGDYYFGITRQNAGLRALFHFGDNDDLDTYAGARVGYSFWKFSTNASSSGVDEATLTSRVWPQALFGMRYYFTDNIGANVEFAVGPPYYLMLGLNARFGGN